MKPKTFLDFAKATAFLLVLSTLDCQLSIAFAQGTAFTYQGRLSDGGMPANGSYDFRLRLATDPFGNNFAGNLILSNALPVTGGLFTLTVDFGAGLFNGSNYWLEVDVKTNGAGGYTALTPLLLVTPAPYAVFAAGVGTVAGSALSGTYGGAVTFSNTGNSFSGNGAGLIGLNAAQLTSGTVPPAALGNVWKTGGNSGTTPDSNFLGTTDNQPLELRVNNTRGLRLEANTNGAPNLIGGAPVNYVASGVGGATIAGGGGADLFNRYTNRVTADFGTVSGGRDNSARNYAATVGGGYLNAASGFAATIPGGQQNVASGNQSFAAGIRANAVHDGSFVWSDRSSLDPFFSTAENQFSVRAGGGIRLAGNLQLDEGDYRYLSLSGGNSLGYIYGSFPALGDGVHLAYNHYYNKFGSSQILHNDGATSRLTVGYGFVGLYVGGVGAAPVTQRLLATSSGITVNGTFNNQSDRNAKQDFAPINSAQILEKVARLPLSEWRYKDDPATRHLGPVAQDFRAAFEIGTDDRHIAPLDEGGVALAAIQGLNQRMEEQRAELKEKEMEITELKQRLDALEKILRGQKTD